MLPPLGDDRCKIEMNPGDELRTQNENPFLFLRIMSDARLLFLERNFKPIF